ncbi:MAG: hypothetical protein ABJN69_07800 [Hellea sp.]
MSIMMASFLLASCKVSVSPGGLEDSFAPDVREDPIPEEYAAPLFAYADGVIADLYKNDIESLRQKTHSDYSDMFDEMSSKGAIKLLNPKTADQANKEYLGYNMYQTKDGQVFTSLFYRVPREGGNDNITLNVDADMTECCRLMGFNVQKFAKKSLLGKD